MMRVPLEERPRERFTLEGGDALTTAELLAIVLGSGTKGQSVLELSGELLAHFGGLLNLLDASLSELTAIKGIGNAKAIQLMALFTIAKRVLKTKGTNQKIIQSSKDAFNAIADLFEGETKEKLVVLLLNPKLGMIHREVIGIGTLTEVLVHPREVFLPAVRFKANSIIVAHNHPSGDPHPSESDILMTKFLKNCGDIMSIKLADHLIIGQREIFSFKDKKMI